MMDAMSISEWWPKLSPSARGQLIEDPRRALTSDLIIAVTHARGVGPAITQWEGQPPARAHLSENDAEWIDEHGTDQI